MLLFEVTRIARTVLVAVVAAGAIALSGCTVQPLYGSDSTGAIRPANTLSQDITIKPASTREELEVRNHLIFLLGGGAGLPDQAPYSLTLGVKTKTSNALNNQIIIDPTDNVGQPTAGIVTMQADYTLTDSRTGDPVAKGRRIVTAEFDRPRQEFASDRAERNANDRAARELAEQLRLAVAQDLEKLGSS